MNARFFVPSPVNEPVLGYAPGSPERARLFARLAQLKAAPPDIPHFIGGEELHSGEKTRALAPHDHGQVVARWRRGGAAEARKAVAAALKARRDWARTPFAARAAVFLKAAELLAGDWRWTLNAATMMGQSKSAHQAEIDSACELIDFLRFNAAFAERLHAEQPSSARGIWNRMDYRPLEGFVCAVTPFNFTAIAGNLPTAPALMGNVVVWKPSVSAMPSAYWTMRLLQAAGLPPGVINLVSGDPAEITEALLSSPDFAGLHYTGSTEVFRGLWARAGQDVARYRSYPRLVGETGGKDFVLVHASADPEAVAAALVRGAFEYQGQKCSAASRAYVPDGLWPKVRRALKDMTAAVEVGSPEDPGCFVNAVINEAAFNRLQDAVARSRKDQSSKLLAGGTCDGRKGWFVHPTVFECSDPKGELMTRELFGPILAVHVYPEKKWRETLKLVDETSPYALTGAVFARERAALVEAEAALENAAGNLYLNDKPTGAVVGQQPFGGARASGTNDKAGSALNLLRWVSPRVVKETFDPPRDFRYPWLARDPA